MASWVELPPVPATTGCAPRLLNRESNDLAVLRHGQRRALTRGAHNAQSSGARFNVVLNQAPNAGQSMAPSGAWALPTQRCFRLSSIYSGRDLRGSRQNFMVSQLSISARVSQLHKALFFGRQAIRADHRHARRLFGGAALCHAQGADFEVLIKPLTAIDRQFMTEQRGRVAALANRLGRGLTGNVDRDLDTLQRILDDRMVPTSDTLTLQAMGLVFGDLLGDRLGMQWVVYRDRQGRSRHCATANWMYSCFP